VNPATPVDDVPRTVFAGLLDDAAVFPPGNAPLPEAVDAHRRHRIASYGDLVGPLVLPASALDELTVAVGDGPPFTIVVTAPAGPEQIPEVLEAATRLPIEIAALEVAVPAEMSVPSLLEALERGVRDEAIDVYVEVPRDDRREPLLAALAGRYRAKLRTGGMRADMYPGEDELASAICAAVAAWVPFKATAGLHHAVRNTDPTTHFEQHGFLNLLLATAIAVDGGSVDDVRAVLAERDGTALATRVRKLGDAPTAARTRFTSFGTCSIAEPVQELTALGLLADPDGGLS
jgi:hypothetical protein